MIFSHKTLTIFSLFIFVFVASCNSQKKTQVVTQPPPNPKPSWVNERPISSSYYVGIGMANKRINNLDYSQIAKNNAFNDMASEIKVNVNANSLLYQFESNNKFKEDFSAATKITSQLNLQDYEVIGSWENETEYWIYYRLSKSKYQEIQQKKIDAAISSAMDNFNRARGLEKQNDNGEALKNYLQAMVSIKEFLGENLETNIDGKQVFLGNEIYKSIQDNISNFRLTASVTSYKATIGATIDDRKVHFKVLDRNNKPIVNTAIKISYKDGKVIPETVFTDAKGEAHFVIDKVRNPKVSTQEIKATLDLKQIFDRVSDDMIKKMAKTFSPSQSQIILNVSSPKLFIEGTEKNLNQDNKQSFLVNAVKRAAAENGFQVVNSKNQADLIIEASGETIAGANSFDMYSAILNGVVKVVDKNSQDEVFNKKLSNIKGVQLSPEKAGLSAFERAGEVIIRDFFPDFLRSYLK